mmetsp:Transcript_95193/g.293563  ORF Transcript_95193/g.293563 Transcript_95193/m.293563 type:complete len:266 (+) Transcript_95193:1548-2345(+)
MHENAPDVLPALIPDSVEECILQRVSTILRPPVADAGHPATVEPLQPVDAGGHCVSVGDVVPRGALVEVAPSQSVPRGALPGCVLRPLPPLGVPAALHLSHDGVAGVHPGGPELLVHRGHGVAVEAVAAGLPQEPGERRPGRLSLVPRVLVPGVVGPEHAHAARLEPGREVLHALQPARHGTEVVELVPRIDADVGVGGPEQDGVDATVPLCDVFEVAVHRVLVRDGVVEVPVVHVCLGLHVGGPRPVHSGVAVNQATVVDRLDD